MASTGGILHKVLNKVAHWFWYFYCIFLYVYSLNLLSLNISSNHSWPGPYRHSDWLLPDEALPVHCSWGHRLDQNLPAWIHHRPPAELLGGVSFRLSCGSTLWTTSSLFPPFSETAPKIIWEHLEISRDQWAWKVRKFWEMLFVCRKQHSLWVQGDVHRSKQKLVQQRLSRRQHLQQQCHQQQLHSPDCEAEKQEAMSHLLSSMDDLSINTTLYKSYSLDEVRGGTFWCLYYSCIKNEDCSI